MSYPNKPYINGKIIYSEFWWCINQFFFQKLLFWMQLIVINRLTALLYFAHLSARWASAPLPCWTRASLLAEGLWRWRSGRCESARCHPQTRSGRSSPTSSAGADTCSRGDLSCAEPWGAQPPPRRDAFHPRSAICQWTQQWILQCILILLCGLHAIACTIMHMNYCKYSSQLLKWIKTVHQSFPKTKTIPVLVSGQLW